LRIRILGAAAGGGLPQWNCCCQNCRDARSGRIPRLTQSSVAISNHEHERWLLVNASPDLPAQIESFPLLQPRDAQHRHSAIKAVCLTNADIDHVLGLILLRQHEEPLLVYAPPQIRNELAWVDEILGNFCPIDWRESEQIGGDLQATTIDLGRSVAWRFEDRTTRRAVLIAPAVQDIRRELVEAIGEVDAIFFDGTFWSDGELKQFRKNARTSREMGHLPVKESLPVLADQTAAHKIYIHINNTNPILQPDSDERKQTEAAGILVGRDGLEFEI
jgi:pyrroloquinoline quinone biosynthesis protein B